MPFPIIPESITVHLGAPDQAAANVTVPFIDYIKNVASGEIYPTWPEESLRANILAQTTFALNRLYTEWYPAQGYDFDITSVTQYDQTYAPDREIFANVSALVDELFNDYVVLGESILPYFTQYCNGTTSQCDGLSQWGTVALAEDGLTALEILRYYYGDDVELVQNAMTGENLPSYGGIPLAVGSAGEDVRILQRELNRIGESYPSIPRVEVADGIYDAPTAAAVTVFQEIFDLPVTGVVDKATWYRIKRIYTAVKGLSELIGEGLEYSEVERLYPRQLQEGDSGIGVRVLQYYLAFLAFFDPDILPPSTEGFFDEATAASLRSFEAKSGLPADGIADRTDWAALVVAYDIALAALPAEYQEYAAQLYPGEFITLGASGASVLALQQAINRIAAADASVPAVQESGLYTQNTADAVRLIQEQQGLPVTGAVGPLIWRAIFVRSRQ